MKHEEAWEAVLADALQLAENVHRCISSSVLWTTAFLNFITYAFIVV